jgi:hypothetical protein
MSTAVYLAGQFIEVKDQINKETATGGTFETRRMSGTHDGEFIRTGDAYIAIINQFFAIQTSLPSIGHSYITNST